MVIVVVVAVAIPIARYYFGDQLSRTFFRNREKLVSMVAQERKQPIPNQWFDQEGGGPDAGPNGNPPDPSSASPGSGPSPAGNPNFPETNSNGAGANNSSTSSAANSAGSSNFSDPTKDQTTSPKSVDSKTEAQENFFSKSGRRRQRAMELVVPTSHSAFTASDTAYSLRCLHQPSEKMTFKRFATLTWRALNESSHTREFPSSALTFCAFKSVLSLAKTGETAANRTNDEKNPKHKPTPPCDKRGKISQGAECRLIDFI